MRMKNQPVRKIYWLNVALCVIMEILCWEVFHLISYLANHGKLVAKKKKSALVVVVLLFCLLCASASCGGSPKNYGSAVASDPASNPAVGQSGGATQWVSEVGSKAAAATTAPPATTSPLTVPNTTADPTHKMVALTFDDGPSGKVTNAILDTLEANGAKATFFCLGNRAEFYETTLRRMVAMGCEIASHSNAHKHLVKLNEEALRKDLKKADDELEKYSGIRPRLLRTPYGETSEKMLKIIDAPIILWSIDTRDWCYHKKPNDPRTAAEIERDCKKIVNEVLENVQDGDIVLMHDLYDTTERSAREVIETLAKDGWQMVTVSELFAAKGIPLEGHSYYRSAK